MIDARAVERLRLLPPIRRARGYRLYAANGRRIVDLWQDGGRAILGHRGGRVLREVSAVLDRGTASPFPSVEERRLARAVSELLARDGVDASPAQVRWYSGFRRALAAAREALGEPTGVQGEQGLVWDDPGLAAPVGADTAAPHAGREPGAPAPPVRPTLWRPFLPPAVVADRCIPAAVLLPVLPVPSAFAFQAVVTLSPQAAARLPASDLVAEPVLRGATVAAAGLVAATASPAEVVVPAGFSAVGPYLTAGPPLEGGPLDAWYDTLFVQLLDSGYLLSPGPGAPSTLPREWSDGERSGMMRAADAAWTR